MANWNNGVYTEAPNAKFISAFLYEDNWSNLKNTSKYGENVVGAIGTVTAEMFIASWNAKRYAMQNDTIYNRSLTLTVSNYGYKVTNLNPEVDTGTSIKKDDDLYIWSNKRA